MVPFSPGGREIDYEATTVGMLAALRICREYRIGRIYESLYLCRRWSGNTDVSWTAAT